MFTEITIAIQQQGFVAEKEISTEMSGGAQQPSQSKY